MKHLLNNLTESEKEEILSKYDGTLQVKIDKFRQLVESRLGDVKINESPTSKRIISESKDPNWYKKFPCLLEYELQNRKQDKTEYVVVGSSGNVYFSNGRAYDADDGKTKYWWCGNETEESPNTDTWIGENSQSPARLAALKKGLAVPMPGEKINQLPASGQQPTSGQQSGERVKYRDCTSKKTFSLGCMDARPKDKNEIMKLQGCLGVTPDGKFGLGTLNKFLQLSPESGGVAKIDTIQKICGNITTAKNLGADDTVPGQ